ncbi:TPA: DUF2829 domain-containing protein [Clostridium botulinum]|nr:DUF2829 domain-containing protein [Clostridium botulinum]HDK7223537.1 DUF2829 domain-containing protein [Clostridium botulinum]HDK7271131.1 DUF2829 domain-containing protein [Clostridium botulinum]HDK7304487.1 DUF2829 domain-containing protein [Clostridium botulinum]
MNLRKALELLKEGKKVARKDWDKNIWIQARCPLLESKKYLPYIYKNDGKKLMPWKSNENDLTANDWMLIKDDKRPSITFNMDEVILALRKSFIASFVPAGGVFTGERADEILKTFKRILKDI